ncbi:SulP family inorganic anion transporter [Verrucomicrobia bacterium LW23]|nr:SulP family inorganic anion transporter [Verrucomicrobia bacterium LW23]
MSWRLQIKTALAAAWRNIKLDPFPLRHSLRGYSAATLGRDTKAGLNVALLAFPQAMAYALIAGLPVQYGIFCAAIAPVVAALFSTSRLTMVGPTNATAVMVLSTYLVLQRDIPPLASMALFTCMVGALLLAGSLMGIAGLAQYVSRSVVIGYVTGAALLIVAHQTKDVLNIPLQHASTFIDIVRQTAFTIDHADPATMLLSAVTAGFWFWISKRFAAVPNVAATLLFSALVGAALQYHGYPLQMLSPLPVDSFGFTPPELNPQWFSLLMSGALAVAFLASLENTFMAKTLAARTGERVDVNQEMFALGAANMASGMLSGMPASGSLSRSGLNWASGAITPVSAITCGLLCGLAAPLLAQLIGYIPRASLAVVVILTAFGLINKRDITFSLFSTKSDAAVFITTFVAALLAPLDTAIFMGVGLSIMLFLRKVSRPHLVEFTFNEQGQLMELLEDKRRDDPQISIIHVEGELFFAAADLFRDEIRRVCADPNLRVVILRMKRARHLDATSVMAMAELIQFLRETDRHLVISGATEDVYAVIKASGLLKLLGKENIFMASPGNPNISTRNALLRAQALLGQKSAPVRIFYDPEKVREREGVAPAGGA